MTTGQELMAKLDDRTRLDAAMNQIMRLVDDHGVAMQLVARYGNQHGDEDKLRSTRPAIEAIIRKLIAP